MSPSLTTESPRAWWIVMLATWALCAALVLPHHAAVRAYVARIDALGLRAESSAATPLRQTLPAQNADAQMWIRHTLAAMETGEARVRFTTIDNAPAGREVHWSSPLVWLLRGAGAAQRALTGQSGSHAIERAALWLHTPLFLAAIIAVSGWMASRAGAGAGVLIALGMLGHHRFYESFAPALVDHHGLISTAVLGLFLGTFLMGAGWWRSARIGAHGALPASPALARHGALASALCGAVGLWLSAATVVPVIALIGVASLGFVFWRGRDAVRDGARFDPELWRLWGRIGAATSFVFYLVEYAPAHLGLRLEVNHPLYSLAWWGGAELVALLGSWWLARETAPAPLPRGRLPIALAAVVAAPLAVLLGGRAVFMVADPFVGELRHFVAEGKSLLAVASQFGLRLVAADLASTLLLVPAAIILWRRRDSTGIAPTVLAIAAAVTVTMGFLEMRWWLNASAAQLALLLALLTLAPTLLRWRWICGLCVPLFILPTTVRLALERSENHRGAVSPADLIQPLYRDIAAALRQSQPEGDIVLLASPNASAGIGYFGRFATLGTLYWENAPGLRAAAEIFSAASDDEVVARLRKHRVTHIVILSQANFLGEYLQLLHPLATFEAARQSFGYRLMTDATPPRWLRPIPHRRPPGLENATRTVRLYQVAFDQTEGDWRRATALARLAEDGTLKADNPSPPSSPPPPRP